jgi:hypothetical protein
VRCQTRRRILAPENYPSQAKMAGTVAADLVAETKPAVYSEAFQMGAEKAWNAQGAPLLSP